MQHLRRIGLVVSGALFGLAIACQTKSANEPTPDPSPNPPTTGVTYQTTSVPFRQPANFPEPLYKLASNPLTAEGIALGKALFYDNHLSSDTTVNCGFCHQQFAGFAHSDHPLSHGVKDRIGTRNVPSLQNMAWYREFFWDGSVTSLDELPMSPIARHDEMDLPFTDALDRVRKSAKYPPMFKAAFGSDTVTTARFLKAISQFMLTLVSADSRYDKYVRNEASDPLSADELAGQTLFKQNCASCHATDLFTDRSYRNNGLPVSAINDQGRYTITLQESDRLKFRVPSLRNLERTFPYMHDGRFLTLEQVLKHYAGGGVVDSPTLDPLLKQTGKLGIALTTTEQAQIIAFLKTLTDNTFLTNRAFAAN